MNIALDCVKLLLLNVWRGQDKNKGILINQKCYHRQSVKYTRKPTHSSKEKEQVKTGAR